MTNNATPRQSSLAEVAAQCARNNQIRESEDGVFQTLEQQQCSRCAGFEFPQPDSELNAHHNLSKLQNNNMATSLASTNTCDKRSSRSKPVHTFGAPGIKGEWTKRGYSSSSYRSETSAPTRNTTCSMNRTADLAPCRDVIDGTQRHDASQTATQRHLQHDNRYHILPSNCQQSCKYDKTETKRIERESKPATSPDNSFERYLSTNNELPASVLSLANKLQRAQKENSKLHQEMERLEESRREAMSLLSSAENDVLRKDLQEKDTLILELQANISDMKCLLGVLRSENQALKGRNAELIAEKQDYIQSLENNPHNQEVIMDMREEINFKTAEVSRIQDVCMDQALRLNKKSEELVRKEEEMVALNQTIVNLRDYIISGGQSTLL